jgi:3-oxoacyl-[acyl-carrier protein] reductase
MTINLGIAGRTALVCAASKGLGRACAHALAASGAVVVINGRNPETLYATAAEISGATGAVVRTVAADVTTEEGRAAILAACSAPDILVNNAGGPPPGDFRDWDEGIWMAALRTNMLAPIFMIKATVDSMIARKFGRIINITSAAVKAPILTLGLSNGARAGLTGFVAGLARQVSQHNVTINNLLPGPFETDRLKANLEAAARAASLSYEEVYTRRRDANPARRYGQPAELGAFCAFMASEQAGYITGQNIVMDGGAYPGTL